MDVFECCESNNVDKFKELLERGICINKRRYGDGMTALHVACRYRSIEIIKLLIDNGAKVNKLDYGNCGPVNEEVIYEDYDLFMFFINNGINLHSVELACSSKYVSIKVVEYLVKRESCYYDRSLLNLCYTGRIDVVKLLLKYGYKSHIIQHTMHNPLIIACGNGQYEIVKLFLDNGSKAFINSSSPFINPIHAALRYGSLNIYKLLLERGSICKGSPLHICLNGYNDNDNRLELVKYLIDHGESIFCRDDSGKTPFMIASKYMFGIAKFLLERGSNVNEVDYYGRSSLYYTPTVGVKSMKFLLENGIDINLRDSNGDTALHNACSCSELECVEMLIDHGADVNIRGDKGDTPLHVSVRGHYRTHHIGISKVLIKNGADVNALNDRGETPLKAAADNNDYLSISALLENGATDTLENLEKIRSFEGIEKLIEIQKKKNARCKRPIS